MVETAPVRWSFTVVVTPSASCVLLRYSVSNRIFAPRLAAAAISSGSIMFCGRSHMEVGLARRSEEHTSELQSLMRISYAVFCLKTKKKSINTQDQTTDTQNTTRGRKRQYN